MKTILLILAFSLRIFANTYYVDNTASGGTHVGTLANPFNSYAQVVNKNFVTGDTISFKCGQVFHTTVEMSEVGKAGLVINSYGTGTRPTINADSTCTPVDFGVNTGTNHVTFNGIRIIHGYPANVSMYRCSYITFESCNIESNCGYGIGTTGNPNCMYSGLGDHLTVRNSTLSYSSGGNGVYVDGTDDCLFEYDTLYNNLHDGFRIAGGDDLASTLRLTVRYCVIKYNHNAQIENSGAKDSYFYYNLIITNPNNVPYDEASGIKLHDQGLGFYPMNCYFYNNTIITNRNYNNEIPAIRIQPTSNITNIVFQNNIIYSSNPKQYMQYWQQVRGDGAISSYIFTNNLYYQPSPNTNLFTIWSPLANNGTYTTLSSWQSTTGYESNSIWGVPLFTDTTNGVYALQSGSPACTTGVNVGLTKDILGNTVPSTNISMGCYQYTTSVSPPILSAPFNGATNIYITVSFSWSAVAGATSYGYLIERYYNGTWSVVFAGTQSGTTLIKTMPLNNTYYRWSVNTNGGTYSSYYYFTNLTCN